MGVRAFPIASSVIVGSGCGGGSIAEMIAWN